MTDTFETAFSKLKVLLDDPDARFTGAVMVDDLLALSDRANTPSQTARIYRELAVVQAKRFDVSCLDHAERALAADADSNVLDEHSLYMMHLQCGDTGMNNGGGQRALAHLNAALELHATLARPEGERMAIRYNHAVYHRANKLDRNGLDHFEPLLRDAEAVYGQDSPELCDLLGQMAMAAQAEGALELELAYAKRAFNQRDAEANPPRMISAHLTLADVQLRAGHRADALNTLLQGVAWADDRCNEFNQGYIREKMAEMLSGAPVPKRRSSVPHRTSWFDRFRRR